VFGWTVTYAVGSLSAAAVFLAMACIGMIASSSVLMLACFPFRGAHCQMGMLIAIASRFFAYLTYMYAHGTCVL
jgi:hypothetical protein